MAETVTENLIHFKGLVNSEILRALLKDMDSKLEQRGEPRVLIKKINSILIECLQNLIHHAEDIDNVGGQFLPELKVDKGSEGYHILTANVTEKENVDRLKSYIDNINGLGAEGLREYYQEVLTNGKFNAKGGAGLGFINIARKTKDNKVHYRFDPINSEQVFFNLHFTV
jgi:hypothetical protein